MRAISAFLPRLLFQNLFHLIQSYAEENDEKNNVEKKPEKSLFITKRNT